MSGEKGKRKQSKSKVSADSREKYGTLLRKSNVGIYKVTPGDKGRFVDVNPAFVKILGYGSKKELLNLNVCDIYVDPSRRKSFSRKISDNEFVKNEELHLKKKDGTPIIASDTGIAVHDTDGRVMYFEGILEDVSERRRIEEALQESEEMYRTLIETSPDSITIIDLNGNFLMVNQVAVEMHGYKNNDDLIKTSAFKMLAPHERSRAQKDLKEFLKSGEPKGLVRGEYECVKKDGTSFYLESNVSVIKDKDGNPRAIMTIARDITERRKIEGLLKESEEQYRKLIDTSPDSITLNDTNGKITMANHAAVRMRGYSSEEELLGKDIMKLLAPHEIERAKKGIQETLRTGQVENVEYVLLKKDGTSFPADVSVSIMKDSKGNPNAFMAIVRDISGRKRVEKALKESEEQYRKLIETSPDSITMVDLNGNLIMANSATAKVYGSETIDELIGKKNLDLVTPEDRERAAKDVKAIIKSGDFKRSEYKVLRKDGNPFSIEANISVIKDGGGKPYAIMTIARDITERKRVEKALKDSEEQYKKLIETSPDPILVTDLDGNIIMANQQTLKVYGCKKKEELIGKNALNIIALHDRKRAIKNHKKVLESGSIKNVEYKLLKNDGTSFIAELSTSLIKDSEGNPKFLIGVVRDITERKRIENALRESEELHRTFIEASPYAITINDMSGKIFLVNQGSVEMHRCRSKEELIGKNAFDFIAPKDKEKLMGRMKKIIETGGEKLMEYTLRDMKGNYFPVEVSSAIIKDKDGRPQAMMAVGRDITERKEMEKALAAEKERLSVTLQSIAESVISVDTEGNIVFMNEVAEKLTGWHRKDAVGKPLCGILNIVGSHNKRVDCDLIIRNVIETGRVTDAIDEVILVAKNETERIIEESCAPIRDNDQNIIGVVLVIRDITEKEKLEKELFKARKLESIGILAGGIAHDFNNILTGITSSLFMAKMEMQKDSAAYKTITDAEKAAFRANKLTSQLLTFAKGGAPIKERQSIREIIEEAVGFSLSGSNVDCDLSMPDELWTLEIDRGQIDQVITNLIINAEQAMPDGGTITVSAGNITISEDVPADTTAYLPLALGKYIKISVKDEGAGIRPEDLDKIYDPYYTTKDSGNGLGLTICYSIVRKHNGLIFAKSRLGVGTTLNVYLPASGKKVREVKEVEKKADLRGAGKVLIMDDEEVVRITAGQILKSIGYIVEYAKNGSEAIKKYTKEMESKKPFDVVVMDLTVPGGMGGKEAVKKLLEIDPEAKAIVSSGYSNDTIMFNYEKFGFCGVVSKPYTVEEFNAIIKKAIAERRK